MNNRTFTMSIYIFTPVLCICLIFAFFVGYRHYLVNTEESYNLFLTSMIFLYPYIILISVFIYRLGHSEIEESRQVEATFSL